MNYTKCQQKAKKALYAFLKDKNPNNFEMVLAGYAGTGKSFLLGRVLEEFKHKKIAYCAVSHAAKNVLIANTPGWADCYTLTSLLGLRQSFNNGKEVFVRDKGAGEAPPITGVEILVVDECSMIDRTLLKLIRDSISKDLQVKIIYSGDPAQLPPVAENDERQEVSPVFSLKNNAYLREVVRYGELIGTLGQYYRDMIDYVEAGGNPELAMYQIRQFRPVWNNGKESVIFTDNNQWFLNEAIKSFQQNELETRIIAYRNTTIDENNDVVRPYFYDPVQKYAPDEYLVLNRPFRLGRMNLHNGTVLRINKAEIAYHTFSVDHPYKKDKKNRYEKIRLKCWRLDVNPINQMSGEPGASVPVIAIHQDAQEDYEDIQNAMINSGKSGNAWSWRHLANLRTENIFAGRYYCVSAYKAQGQSINSVFCMANDILDVSKLDVLTILRALYVSVTRAKKSLTVLL